MTRKAADFHIRYSRKLDQCHKKMRQTVSQITFLLLYQVDPCGFQFLDTGIKPSYDWLMEGEAMVAVQGLYKGGDTVAIDTSSLPPMNEPYEVIVTFLHPQQNNKLRSEQELTDKRQAGFETFMKYKGRLPVDFDYRKELADYREERYGHIN